MSIIIRINFGCITILDNFFGRHYLVVQLLAEFSLLSPVFGMIIKIDEFRMFNI